MGSRCTGQSLGAARRQCLWGYTVYMRKRVGAADRQPQDPSIRDKAYALIQRKIVSGELEAGSAVSELALAKELGSSRTPIREALGQLIAEGLLEQSSRGALVVELSRQDIVDLYELREALESYAIGKAARHKPREADVERLQKLVDEILVLKEELDRSGKAALDPHQMHRFMGSDLAFHAFLMRLAANARIIRVVNETRLLIRIFAMRHRGHASGELERIYRQHNELLKAVAGGEPERAMGLIAEHIQNSQRERLDEFDHWEREKSLRDTVPAFYKLLAPPE
jgi:DNA-binding GntR family transcriptional regulator